MNERSTRVARQGIAAFLWLIATTSCSAQATPKAGAPTPAATPSAGAASAPPPPASAPSASPVPANPRLSPDGKLCGGIAGFRCPDKNYCSFAVDAHCGAGDQGGTCQPIPELCTMEFAPVCGCDGKTYSNACVAGRSGVSVSANGPCAESGQPAPAIADGKICGTRGAPGDCEGGSYCAYRAQCGATDAGGKCTQKPQLCPHLVAPVCGCDQKTYNNACEAARAGVSVSAPGPCKPN